MQKILCAIFIFVFASCCIISCNEPEKKTEPPKIAKRRPAPKSFSYQFVKPSQWSKTPDFKDPQKRRIAFAVNRTDSAYFRTMDSVLIPTDITADVEAYLPFPFEVPFLKEVSKLILFSYPAQAFGAYENGELVYAGPTNMGRKKDPTPTGLFFTNWKAEESTSTFDDEWNLRWNFNIENKLGVGWHQYAMPGYPASHSCLRLQEDDAKYLYTWAEQWKLGKTDTIILKGTPVIVFGNYDFKAAKPWLKLAKDPAVLNISADELAKIVEPYYAEIIHWQQQRQLFKSN